MDIPRTSSSSIRVELGRKYGMTYSKSHLLDKSQSKSQIFPDHIPAKYMRSILGEQLWETIYSFTFVRNPWDRIVSLYYLLQKLNQHNFPFNEFIMELDRFKAGEPKTNLFSRYYGNHLSNCGYILDDDNKIIVDFVGKFENRAHDIKIIADNIGFDSLGSLVTQRTTPISADYRHHYNDKTKNIIAEIYKNDIEFFDYKFD